MPDATWRLGMNDDNTVDEVVMQGAYVHLEDMGDAYMLIVENSDQHIHVTIPSPRKRKAWIFEQHTVTPSGGPEPLEGT